jgi:nicotinate-nucleotide pyrophosphorylase (carboxylating)
MRSLKRPNISIVRPADADAPPAASGSLFCPDAFISPLEIDEAVNRALAEDLGRAGDITSIATVPEHVTARAALVARKAGTIAGLPLVAATFRRLAPDIEIAAHARDGISVAGKTELMTVAGPARAILAAERTALNFIGALSGTATATARYVRRIAHTRTRVICTRKTVPGLRALQKYAIRCGGGFNHRFGLDDAVLIKDNHLAIAGSVAVAVTRVRDRLGHLVKIEVEVDTLDQLDQLLALGVDAVLLDNMAPAMLAEAVARVDGRMITEASGGIKPDTIAAVAASGVDLISLGWLTHSVANLDVALDFEAR